MTKLVALDLDGTLTQHKSPLGAECRETLAALAARYTLLMVCAGGCERVWRQMGGFGVDIIGLYGMERAVVEDGMLRVVESVRVETDKDDVAGRVARLRQTLGFTEYDGDGVEFHGSGAATFPLLGTGAAIARKLAFDPDRRIRRGCYAQVCAAFGGFNVFVGGSSSFDIVPKPYGKRYALARFMAARGLGLGDVVFFGDDYGVGGNDEDVYQSGIRFITIDDYRDFSRVAKEALL